jgi:hypothetical protein
MIAEIEDFTMLLSQNSPQETKNSSGNRKIITS